ncbi:MAG TPA: DUF6531 domain-containing protein, partial [Blastocatellia bacterium]|nr:DUF6531 domain-containing protein [Blastocatellia bacterium]
MPIYFTVQPGGAYIHTYNESGPKGARIIYPNYKHEAPGTRMSFWHYDPEERGWYIYGAGSVDSVGRQAIPDPGVAVYEFTGAMLNAGMSPPAVASQPCNCASDGDPVDLGTGLFTYNQTDLVLPDIIPITLTRTYRPNDAAVRPFGIGANHPYGIFLYSANQYQEADLVLPDGAKIHYVRTTPGTSYTTAVFEATSTPTGAYKSRIVWNGNGWDLTMKDGSVLVFGENAPLQAIRDRNGNQLTLTRTNGQLGNITRVTSPNGRWIEFTYDGSNRVTQARDNIGRTVGYTYDASGRLFHVTDAAGGVTEYTYDSSHRMLTIKDATNIVYLTNQYDANGRVTLQTQADGTTYQFAYTLDGSGKITQTTVIDPRGNTRTVTFNSSGYKLTDTRGCCGGLAHTIERQAGTSLPLSVTDPLGRRTDYNYDSMGNVTSITRMAGTPEAVSMTLTYEPVFNQVATVTDPLNHTSTYQYDVMGNLTTVTDPLNHSTTFGYNAAGQIVSVIDTLNHTTQFAYEGADLVSATDPLGRTVKRFVDAAGRVLTLTNALGEVVRYEYDSLNRRTKVIDPLQGQTVFDYNANS